MKTRKLPTINFNDLDPRTQVRIENRARKEGKTPEAVAVFILEKRVGVTRKQKGAE